MTVAEGDRWRAVRSVTQVHKWWASKIGPLLAAAYLALLVVPAPLGEALVRLVALVGSACLLATSAYVVNDWFDREEDQALGKPSTTGARGPGVVLALIAALVTVGVAPWVVLGLPAAGWVALAAIIGLPLVYSAPPVRWKERGWLGLVADAGLAHVAPTVFALAAFGALSPPDPSPATTAATAGAVAWAAAVGIRKIIGHEIVDADNDRAGGLTTWVTGVGEERAARVVRRGVLPVEVVALAVVYAGLWGVAPWSSGVFTVVAALLAVARLAGAWTEPLPAVPTGEDQRCVLYLFYRLWPAVGLAVGLVAVDPAYAWVLVGHLCLFAPLVVDEATRCGAFVRDHVWAGTVGWLRHDLWVWVSHTVPDWFRYRLWEGVRYSLPSWFRHRLGPWVRHTVPNWFRHRAWVWISHTVPSWFRYRLPSRWRTVKHLVRRGLAVLRHPRRAAARRGQADPPRPPTT